MFQHEIAVINNDKDNPFPMLAITNLDHVKTLHLAKGEIVGFATNEWPDVTYIATVNELDIDIESNTSLKNWIPKRKQRPLTEGDEHSSPLSPPRTVNPKSRVRREEGMTRHAEGDKHSSPLQQNRRIEKETASAEESTTLWSDINEVIELDFLISPGDIYPNRKVLLEDADICQEIETLEKAGVIERSLSPWASPVIVVPKKSAPDEPPRRRLCVDYRKVNYRKKYEELTSQRVVCHYTPSQK